MEQTLRAYCQMPALADVVSKADLKQWRERQLAEIRTAWEAYLRGLGAKYQVTVLSLPVPEIYRQRSMLAELTNTSDTLLRSLAKEGVIDWLDLRTALNGGDQPECALFRDPWHLNRTGQELVTAQLISYMKQRWYGE